MDAVNASVEALHWVLVKQLTIGGAGDAGGSCLDFLIADAERRAV